MAWYNIFLWLRWSEAEKIENPDLFSDYCQKEKSENYRICINTQSEESFSPDSLNYKAECADALGKWLSVMLKENRKGLEKKL